ncbi:MAG: hypothetical protein LBL47_04045 [Lactobacillus sp.]|jgi:hypothetical protein|nr:hypothetical protein [Lactobacillus sp.]
MENSKFYIISEDIYNLMMGAGTPENYYTSRGYKIPDEGLFQELRKDMEYNLRDMFTNVKTFSEKEMDESMNAFAKTSKYPVVSLDRVYINKTPKIMAFLDVTRINDNGCIKLMTRTGSNYVDVNTEVSIISNKIKTITGKEKPEISIVDDVIFSGEAISDICKMFADNDITVREAFGGICTDLAQKTLSGSGIDVNYGYQIDNFIDQICERDFYLGVPQSGIFINKEGSLFKRPYFSPFGDPVTRASIPEEKSTEFSIKCLDRASLLYKAMEDKSKKAVMVGDLPEAIYNLGNKNAKVVDVIKNAKDILNERRY